MRAKTYTCQIQKSVTVLTIRVRHISWKGRALDMDSFEMHSEALDPRSEKQANIDF